MSIHEQNAYPTVLARHPMAQKSMASGVKEGPEGYGDMPHKATLTGDKK